VHLLAPVKRGHAAPRGSARRFCAQRESISTPSGAWRAPWGRSPTETHEEGLDPQGSGPSSFVCSCESMPTATYAPPVTECRSRISTLIGRMPNCGHQGGQRASNGSSCRRLGRGISGRRPLVRRRRSSDPR